VPGYEILGELGRGGMGVVYKARQFGLGRLVALKMILAGGHSGADDLDRFRLEAQAIARLQHANIVAVHEVGEHDGKPFFSLEFCSGGSLDRKLAGSPLPPTEAARLTELLARAMHAAHRANIIHRDLKPANVLLTEDGTPKITDFGLAKKLDDQGKTQTGAVMGTPSYMAPEQAGGHTRTVGPPADIYALGAILYECLTASPPFRGDSVMDTLLKVMNVEPVPPSRLVRRVPRDLETICLKCLMKEPAQRYSSALALAQDLERYQAGEPILARQEGAVRRVGRRLRRYWKTLAAALLVGLGVAAAGYLAVVGQQARRISDLQNAIEAGLAASDWTPAQVAEVEERIGELQKSIPKQADRDRERLRTRLREAVQEGLARPRLEPEDVARIEETLRMLAARDAEAAGELRRRLRRRLRDWETVFTLRPPFADRGTVFADGAVREQGASLVRIAAGAPGTLSGPTLLTRVPCVGNVQMEAVFDARWDSTSEIGLLLNARPDHRGYALLLSKRSGFPPVSRSSEVAAPLPAADAWYLQIHRAGTCLREQAVRLPEGPLTLRAGREGDQLTVQANDLPPLRFLDAFPLAMGDSVYGLLWREGIRLLRVQGRRQAEAVEPSPLERGDNLYATRQYGEALDAYRQQLQGGRTTPAAQETRYKEALCLERLNRIEEAVPLLEQVAAAEGNRWPLAATVRLWLFYLERRKAAEAEAIFATVSARYRFEEFVAVLPDDSRRRILELYDRDLSLLDYLLAPPGLVATAERAVQAATFLQSDSAIRLQGGLLRAYWVAGRSEKALEIASAHLRRCRSLPEADAQRLWAVLVVLLDYCWLHRLQGEAGPALAEFDSWLYKAPEVFSVAEEWPNLGQLVLERARLHAALNDWAGAEKDIATCFRLLRHPGIGGEYFTYSTTYLIHGFLCERRGDREAARAAWREGTWKVWRQKQAPPKEVVLAPPTLTGSGGLHNLILMSLVNEMTEEEAQQFLKVTLASLKAESATTQLTGLLQVPPSVLRQMWQSPRGRDQARKIAFRETAFAEHMRSPLFLLGFEWMRQGAFAAELSADQDALLWKLAQDVFARYAAGKVSKTQAVQLALTWKGVTGFLSWDAVAPGLPAELRGPLAYVVGHRFLRLNKPKEAQTFFQTAVADAPPASPLARLARAELDRLRKP
jgi:tetratricopeptide (TPR) repeat protein